MDLQNLEDLINCLFNSQDDIKMQKATETLPEFSKEPQSIFSLIQLFGNTESNQIERISIFLLQSSLKQNFHKLNPHSRNLMIDKLLEISFSKRKYDYDFTFNILFDIICKYIENNTPKINFLISIINSSFSENIYASNYILSRIIPKLSEDSPILLDNKENFFNYSLEGLQEGGDLLIPSIKLYFSLKEKKLSAINEPHLDIIITFASNITNDQLNSNFWEILNKTVTKNLIPKDKIIEIFNCIIETEQYNQYSSDFKGHPVKFFINSVNLLNEEQVSKVIDFFCSFCILTLRNDFEFSSYLIAKAVKSIRKIKNEVTYNAFKKKIVEYSKMENEDDQESLTMIYLVIIKVFPNYFLCEYDSFIENIKILFDKNDMLLHLMICNLLYQVQNTFQHDDEFAIVFLPKILELIISNESQIQTEAFKIAELFMNSINIRVPWLFNSLWSIQDYFFIENEQKYISLLAKSIDMDNNIGLFQINKIIDFYHSHLNYFVHLPIIYVLMKKDAKIFDTYSKEIINILLDPTYSNDDNLQFLYSFYNDYGGRFINQLQPIITNMQKNLSSTKYLDLQMFHTCCILANCTSNHKLAGQLQKKLIEKFLDQDEDHNTLLDSFSCVINLLNKNESKKLLFNVYLLIIQTTQQECFIAALKTIKKLLCYSCDEDKEFYINKCKDIFDKFINGSFIFMQGRDIFAHGDNIHLMDALGDFLCEFVRHQSQFTETICNFIIKVVKAYPNAPFIVTYIGSFYEIFSHKTGSQKVIQEIIDLVPQMIQNAKFSSLKQNIAFMFVSIAQYDEKVLQSITQYVPVLQNWFHEEKNKYYCHKNLLSKLAMSFLALFANGMKIEETLLNEAINEFPPFVQKDTTTMMQSIISIFTKNEFDSPSIKNAALSLSRMFLLDEREAEKRKVPYDLLENARKLIIAFSKSTPEVIQILNEKYKDSKDKIATINDILKE